MSPQENKKSTPILPRRRLSADFFARDIHVVARDLVGRVLGRSVHGTERRGRIVEVEVYEGPNDAASHARSGEPTARTEPMFAEPGTLYVYTIYGMYQCLNIRAPSTPGPGAILIRACAPLNARAAMAVSRGLIESSQDYAASMERRLMSGPGKLCQALHIDPSLSGQLLGDEVWLEVGQPVVERQPDRLRATARIGLNRKTCGDCTDRLWRYVLCDSPWTSH